MKQKKIAVIIVLFQRKFEMCSVKVNRIRLLFVTCLLLHFSLLYCVFIARNISSKINGYKNTKKIIHTFNEIFKTSLKILQTDYEFLQGIARNFN